jgi:nucleotide-binding universal stress UspA family protein
MFHRVMVVYDDSREAAKAFQTAIKLARALPAELSVVTVDGDEVGSIVGCARRHRADLLVLGMPKYALGHTGKDLADRSPCALMGIR